MSDLNIEAVLGPQYEIVINQDVVNADDPYNLTLTPQEPLVLAVGTGFNVNPTATGTLDVQITAQEVINAYRAVTYEGFFAQPNAESLSKYAGVNRVATIIGEPLMVVREGLMTEDGWSWTPNAPIFIGTDGVLTQASPVFGTPVRRIAWAISATTINLEPYPIIGV
ncbi:hypothetical protein RDp07_gp25 [Roseobacter phage RD-1410Ws-07]|uniref:Uncharacterized protein n=2 Tax=Sanyabayvirus DS1410Ws06 TaxID=2844087 RepID=A0A191VYQ0_9CAUD|nr:hypothetical protein HYO98_gp28 [Dinoroseobacter phage DS-1410Ws-06]ANJ20685.1 hypothetical protein DSp06_gp28 [Dinoroseobacter phage DS-1410Ws-06]ANJ20836.1 hypothetical protein RDp07_gp25 [Roseobacter phage RD-1410Ws-07]